MESKKPTRFEKGSDAAKAYMNELRSKRKGNKGGGSTPAPAAICPPCTSVEKPKLKRNTNKISVDF